MKTRLLVTTIAIWALLLALCALAQADIQLPSVIGDNMVLQRQAQVAIWGWDTPGASVDVEFRGCHITTKAAQDGKFLARIPSGLAGTAFTLTIAGSSTMTLHNVAVGEVWVAGGQSNMWFQMSNVTNAAAEAAKATDPDIRMWDANTEARCGGYPADTPQRTVNAQWAAMTPQNIGRYPSTAYFFARELRARLHVPIGILHVAVPGTDIEWHISPELMRSYFPSEMQLQDQQQALYKYQLADYNTALSAWQAAKADAEKNGTKVPEQPKAPAAPRPGAGCLYNGMVAPAIPYTIKGFIWWQGENNAGRSEEYRLLFPMLIQQWREAWGEEDAPFLYVQLHNFGYRQPTLPVEDAPWPAQRDAQTEALCLPYTAMISTIDMLKGKDISWEIHPKNKQLAGYRLSLAAMALAYGDSKMVYSGPTVRDYKLTGSSVTVTFDNVAGGLQTEANGPLKGFALAGADHKFYWAEGKISGKHRIILSSKEVANPIAVRYAWANSPITSLYNSAGLPASPFRSDNWILHPH